MRNHLKPMHKTEFSELEKCEEKKRDAFKTLSLASSSHERTKCEKQKQISNQDCIEKKKQWDDKSVRSLEVDNSISEMIALDDLPFSFVESLGLV